MLAARILGYGPEYQVEIENELGEKDKITVDLSKVQTKETDLSKLTTENKYEFTTIGGQEIEFKLLTHGDTNAINAEINEFSIFGVSCR